MQMLKITCYMAALLLVLNHSVASQDLKDNTVYSLDLLVAPAYGGSVEGSGNYPVNEEVLVSATPAPTHAFIHWKDQFGDVIATESSFTFVMPAYDVELTAHFTCVPDWNPELYHQFNMQVVGHILVDDEISLNPNDMVGAFVNDECRGVASPMPEFGGLVFLTVGSNQLSGETVELRIWQSELCESCYTTQSFAFANEGEVGSYFDPLMISCPTEVTLELGFNQGYTWFSLNVSQESYDPNNLFSALEPCYDDRIIGQHAFALYSGEQWIGNLMELSTHKMYRMRLCSEQSISLVGEINMMDTIYLNAGYSWLGYLPHTCLPLNTALAGLYPEPAYNDRIIAQSAFALFNGNQWIGSLTQMCPGEGYIIKLSHSSSLNFAGSQRWHDSSNKNTVRNTSSGLSPVQNLQHTMLMLAKLKTDAESYSFSSGDMVYAYVDNELRGMATPMPENDGLIFMNIGANHEEAQKVHFKVWLDVENRLFDINEQFHFESLKAVGQLNDPFVLSIQSQLESPPADLHNINPLNNRTPPPYTIPEGYDIH